MKIPSRSEWGAFDDRDLDGKYALKQFLGKSSLEAEALFAANSLHYQEDLRYMPDIPFNFYVRAFASYLRSDGSQEDSDGASTFLSMVGYALTKRAVIFPEVREDLIATARIVSARQAFYEADEDIYGSFPDVLREIEAIDEARRA